MKYNGTRLISLYFSIIGILLCVNSLTSIINADLDIMATRIALEFPVTSIYVGITWPLFQMSSAISTDVNGLSEQSEFILANFVVLIFGIAGIFHIPAVLKKWEMPKGVSFILAALVVIFSVSFLIMSHLENLEGVWISYAVTVPQILVAVVCMCYLLIKINRIQRIPK